MSQVQHVHFIGIGGSGMSAIAKVMTEMGYHVSGSDIQEHGTIKQLQAQGVRFYLGHHKKHVQGADMIVYSSGIPKDNIELYWANQLNIPVLHRSQALAQLLNHHRGIAVTGAHGKTTTSSMISCMMTKAGLDPTFLIGGEVLDFGYNARAGKGEFVIAEADESDGSFLSYFPEIAVITNIEADHLENYKGNFDLLKETYVQFIHQIKHQGKLIICMDDPIIREIMQRKDMQAWLLEKEIETVSYGLEQEGLAYTASTIQLNNRSSSFTLCRGMQELGEMELRVPGKHNILNALACAAIGDQLSISLPVMRESLQAFIGAKRRFQVVSEEQDILIVDDYAHHPTEIIATLEAARSTDRRIFAIFQPQRYTRTYYLLDAFSYAFSEADEVIITTIYSPKGEKPIEGISSMELAQRIKENSVTKVTHIENQQEIVEYIARTARSGDCILTMGAGDIWKVANLLREYYRKVEPLA